MSSVTFSFVCLTLLFGFNCTQSHEKKRLHSANTSISDSISSHTRSPDTQSIRSVPQKKKKMGLILQCALNNNRFDPQKWLDDDRSFPPPGLPGKISQFDHIIRKMSRRYGFDWRLIAAQIYAESRFDTTAKSHVGARGLMQIMPKTAQYLGTNPTMLEHPEVNIATGCQYDQKMVTLWKRNSNDKEQRLAFALASYNAGRGRVLRSFSTKDSLTDWARVHPFLPVETQDYVHRIALKYDFYSKHALP